MFSLLPPDSLSLFFPSEDFLTCFSSPVSTLWLKRPFFPRFLSCCFSFRSFFQSSCRRNLRSLPLRIPILSRGGKSVLSFWSASSSYDALSSYSVTFLRNFAPQAVSITFFFPMNPFFLAEIFFYLLSPMLCLTFFFSVRIFPSLPCSFPAATCWKNPFSFFPHEPHFIPSLRWFFIDNVFPV